MSEDPILDEVRQAKKAHAERFGCDVHAICADLMVTQQLHEAEGWVLLTSPAAPPFAAKETLQQTRFAGR